MQTRPSCSGCLAKSRCMRCKMLAGPCFVNTRVHVVFCLLTPFLRISGPFPTLHPSVHSNPFSAAECLIWAFSALEGLESGSSFARLRQIARRPPPIVSAPPPVVGGESTGAGSPFRRREPEAITQPRRVTSQKLCSLSHSSRERRGRGERANNPGLSLHSYVPSDHSSLQQAPPASTVLSRPKLSVVCCFQFCQSFEFAPIRLVGTVSHSQRPHAVDPSLWITKHCRPVASCPRRTQPVSNRRATKRQPAGRRERGEEQNTVRAGLIAPRSRGKLLAKKGSEPIATTTTTRTRNIRGATLAAPQARSGRSRSTAHISPHSWCRSTTATERPR